MRFVTNGGFVRWPGGADRPTVTVVCFGWAGAGAGQFRAWREWLPAETDLVAARLPGREDRLREAPYADMATLVGGLADDLDISGEFVFFGHCMGAVVAFELVHELRHRGERLPAALCVASAPPARVAADPPSQDVRAELRGVGMVPDEVLDDPVLFEMLRPAVAADFDIVASYRHSQRTALSVPVIAYRAEDEHTDIAGWSAETTGEFRSIVLPGQHLFPSGAWRSLATTVARHCTAVTASPTG